MDIYKFAAQNGLRFASSRGDLTVEQLFQIPLKSGSGFDLDNVARAINTELKELTQESFVDTNPDPRQHRLTVALEIVKDVIKTKQDEGKANELRRQKEAMRQKLLDVKASKQEQSLASLSEEEIDKKLAELSAQ